MYALRPATTDDIPWLFALHKAALRRYIEPLWGWDEAWQHDYFTSTLNLADSRIITLAAKPIGRLTVEDRPTHTFLAYLALLPTHQRQGIGAGIIREVVAQAKLPVRLSVLSTNPARALYERLGFRVIAQDAVRLTMQYG
jgi:ribosomal protein S18 acetylase RimI-like enzyme